MNIERHWDKRRFERITDVETALEFLSYAKQLGWKDPGYSESLSVTVSRAADWLNHNHAEILH